MTVNVETKKKKRKTVKEKNKELAPSGKQVKNYGIILNIHPSEKQEEQIKQTIGCSRLIYNTYLSARQTVYGEKKETLGVGEFKKTILKEMKNSEEYGFLKSVDKFSLEKAAEHVEKAYNNFFEGNCKFPKFKRKHKSKQSYKTCFTNNNIKIVGNTIQLPKLGKVLFSVPKKKYQSEAFRKLVNKEITIQNVTVSERAGRFYASVTCEEIVDIVKPLTLKEIDESKIVGIDLGLTDFATITDGKTVSTVENPRYYRKSEKKLAKLQKRLSKKKLGSSNWLKAKAKVSKINEKIANQRKSFLHSESRRLCNENQVVVVEDLNIKGMVRNRRLAKSIHDAGWSRFLTYLKYKLEWEGKHLIKVNRWYASSKICNVCKEKKLMLSLSERTWVCSSCGEELERDANACRNIREEGIRLFAAL